MIVSRLYRYQTPDMPHERYLHVRIQRLGRPHPTPPYYAAKPCRH